MTASPGSDLDRVAGGQVCPQTHTMWPPPPPRQDTQGLGCPLVAHDLLRHTDARSHLAVNLLPAPPGCPAHCGVAGNPQQPWGMTTSGTLGRHPNGQCQDQKGHPGPAALGSSPCTFRKQHTSEVHSFGEGFIESSFMYHWGAGLFSITGRCHSWRSPCCH